MTDGTTGNADSNKPVPPAGPPAQTPSAPEPRLYKDDLVQGAPDPSANASERLADEVGLKLPERTEKAAQPPEPPFPNPPAPVQTPSSSPAPAAAERRPVRDETNLGTDIAKILEEVKLPERRDVKGTADRPPPKQIPVVQPGDFIEAPVRAQPAAEQPEAPAGDKVSAVHTLKQDLQGVVRDQKISLVKAVSLEQDRAHPEPIETPVNTGRTRSILFFSALFLLLGAAALGGVYYVLTQRTNAPAQTQLGDSIVFAEQNAGVSIDDQSASSLKNQIAQARVTSSATLGSITRVVPLTANAPADVANGAPAQRPATLAEFFAAIGARPPADLMRALGDTFFFGIHTVDKNAPVLVIPVASYDRAFAGMLEWEKTLNNDLAPVYTAVPALTLGPDGLPAQREFTDLVMRNYDVRALKDDAGNIQLYYSFPTRNILVIAESPYTFTEVLSRLQAGRRL